MEDTKEIIRSIIDEAVAELMDVIANDLGKMSLSNIVQTTQAAVNKLGVRIISRVVAIADDIYYEQRDKHKNILRNIKTRRMASAMGEIELTRRLYYDKLASKYFFAVDELLDIEKHSRIESEFKAQLINNATLTSYGKASKISNDKVSRQTVCNLVKRVRAQDLTVQSDKLKKVDKLYIEADEDHIHLNNGKPAEVKLVYVHEGRRRVGNGRMELINPKYFAACGGVEIWTAVADYVFAQYDVRMKDVQLSGDGALWIKSGLDEFPGAQYSIDKFHVYKSVTDAAGGDREFHKKVLDCIKRGDKERMLKLYATTIAKTSGFVKSRYMAGSLAYLDNNFDEIDLMSEYGCSAEGHISHVLSARMSSRPMAWGIAGADKMAKLRAFYFNGGNFSELISRHKPVEDKTAAYNFIVKKSEGPDGSIPSGHFVAERGVLEEIKKILCRETEQSEFEAEEVDF